MEMGFGSFVIVPIRSWWGVVSTYFFLIVNWMSLMIPGSYVAISKYTRNARLLPPIGIVARRAISRYGISRQNKNASSNRPQKATSQTAGLQCHDALWDKCERLFRTGDIISVTDKDNSLSYFAQIRTLLCNQLGQRFAALTWLVPTESADEAHQFDAEHFVHALSDSVMYPLEVCTFVQHAPLLPGYCHDWKPRSLVEKKLHEDLEKRVQIADSVLYEYELNNFVNPIIIITIEAIEVTELWKITKYVIACLFITFMVELTRF
ncbi:hypothetical protein DINM_000584 [Dirofilaria immitis]|nr:hypothetical protein [Dirofilaria immitis]